MSRKSKKTRPRTAGDIAAERLGDAPQPLAETVPSDNHRGFLSRVARKVVGKPRDLLDPRLFHHVRLIAFLAWVGLGADGLSSSCYGPEEAYRALGQFHFLAVYLVVAVMTTVIVISMTYSQIIEHFPSGGGGYIVASKLLGPAAGLVSGCALVVDYALTIAISVASGADQIWSFLDPKFLPLKLAATFLVVGFLVVLNLRGVKESVTFLLPVFLTFVLSHAILIAFGLLSHLPALPSVLWEAGTETRQAIGSAGLLATGLLLMKAYSLGGGTFTGIEAVSNGLPILAEPRVETGKRTMRYMSFSLAFTAGGILFCYMLLRVQPVNGKTLNAVLFEGLTAGWNGALPIGSAFVVLSLVAEACLLFVAAQAGFLDGPRILASMAVDSWMPHRFAMLSDRMVTRNGVLVMGTAAFGFLALTRGSVSVLVVLYSINVFLTFSLSQLSMARLYWRERAAMPDFARRFGVMVLGLTLTSSILVATLTLKFREGGWATVAITGAVIVAALFVKSHYRRVRAFIADLDETLLMLPPRAEGRPPETVDTRAPTAAILVSGYNGLGIHTLYTIIRLFPSHYRNFVFISAAIVDSERFKGRTEVDGLRDATRQDLERYVAFANHLGLHAESQMSLGTDPAAEVERMAVEITRRFPRAVFFAGRLVFPVESFFTRLLHNETGLAIQRRLHLAGIPMVVLPIRAR
ncbi:MAG: APC family permease [Acidobacteriota bacterium]